MRRKHIVATLVLTIMTQMLNFFSLLDVSEDGGWACQQCEADTFYKDIYYSAVGTVLAIAVNCIVKYFF